MAKRNIKETIENAAEFAQEKYLQLSDAVVKAIDQNGDGKVGIEDMITLALKNKLIYVNRAAFLKKAFMKTCDEETINKAIATTPAKANIKREYIEKVAQDAIKKQNTIATSSSVALGYVPGGLAVDVTTTVADVTQFYAHLLIIIQKLLYLYGFPELEIKEGKDVQLDDGTMNMLIICLGAMAGVNEACQLLNNIANSLAKGVQKKLMQQALTKSAIWPILKKILSYFSINLTKDLASKTVANSIKFLGGALVGGLTYASFRKCGNNFIKCIDNTILSNPEKYINEDNVIDVTVTAEKLSEELSEGIIIETE